MGDSNACRQSFLIILRRTGKSYSV